MYIDFFLSEIGYWVIKANEHKLLAISFSAEKPQIEQKTNPITQKTYQQLKEYFNQNRKSFDIPLETESYSEFYQNVWKQVSAIPYGKTSSYSKISNQLNNPKAVRAVGTANGRNPFPIIIPCHRVIGVDGSMTGYAFGIDVKRYLLEMEGAIHRTPTLF